MTKNLKLKMSAIEIYKKVLNGELKTFPKNFWDDNAAIECTRYLIEERLNWTIADIKANLTIHTFKSNKLAGMMARYNNGTYTIINMVYPDKIKPWEMKKAPSYIWTDEKIREVTKWLIEEKLKWNDNDIKKKLSLKTFSDNKLACICRIHNDSPYKIINITYPDKFKPWELNNVPLYTWDKSTAIKATKWLIEEKLKWDIEYAKKHLSIKTFESNRLSSVILLYNGNLTNIMKDTYPLEFKNFSFKDR